jgi:methyl-accepting chemotaxis protein
MLSFAAVILCFVVALATGWTGISSVSGKVKHGYQAAVVAQSASAAAYNVHVSEMQYVADGGHVMQMHRSDKAAYEQLVGQLKKLATTPAELAALKDVDAKYAAWMRLDAKVFGLVDAGKSKEALALVEGPANSAADGLSTALGRYDATVRKAADHTSSSATASARTRMGLFALLALFIAGLMSWLLARIVSSAVSRISAFARKVAEGDLTERLQSENSDEFGRLSDSLDEMVENLANMSGRVLDNAQAVNASATEILATVTQQSAGANQQSAAINETTTATEEIRASAEQASRTAEEVSAQAQDAARAGDEGAEAVEAIVHGMEAIREKVAAIAGDVNALSEQTAQIGEITSAVNDLADQSNLLALNATIEAARAGEQGKGFAVVADEVRNLAEQSKQATAQVQAILEEIERATRAAVTGAQEGTEVVEHGAELAQRAGEVIAQLAETNRAVGQAAQQISAAAQQQHAGMDQIPPIQGRKPPCPTSKTSPRRLRRWPSPPRRLPPPQRRPSRTSPRSSKSAPPPWPARPTTTRRVARRSAWCVSRSATSAMAWRCTTSRRSSRSTRSPRSLARRTSGRAW